MSNKILDDVKKLNNIDVDDPSFDLDIQIHTNSVFSTLQQLGVGPETGFAIVTGNETWDDYTVLPNALSAVKSYIFLRVRLLFDPPTNPSLLTSLKEQRLELEWRLNVTVDTKDLTP